MIKRSLPSLLTALLPVVSMLTPSAGTRSALTPGVAANPCDIGDTVAPQIVRARVLTVLTDSMYESTVRLEAGMTGLSGADVSMVSDTVICRQALAAFQGYHASLDSSFAIIMKEF